MGPHRLPLTYVLPLRWADDTELDELTRYLRGLAGLVQEVVVVDGSPPALLAAHARAWHGLARHERPDPWPGCNGKVAGVMTGVRLARHERRTVYGRSVGRERDGSRTGGCARPVSRRRAGAPRPARPRSRAPGRA